MKTAINDRMAAMGFDGIGRARRSKRHRRSATVPLSLYKCRRHHSRPSHTSTLGTPTDVRRGAYKTPDRVNGR
jgi:hypothetical protein